ncbi:hypothetical protein Tco_1066860, partial [Tanacetum coccineum]
MELRVKEGKTSKDQTSPLEKITEDRKAGTSSPPTEDLIMDFFLAYPKAQEKSLPHKRSQIEEAVRSGQLSYLVKGIKK